MLLLLLVLLLLVLLLLLLLLLLALLLLALLLLNLLRAALPDAFEPAHDIILLCGAQHVPHSVRVVGQAVI